MGLVELGMAHLVAQLPPVLSLCSLVHPWPPAELPATAVRDTPHHFAQAGRSLLPQGGATTAEVLQLLDAATTQVGVTRLLHTHATHSCRLLPLVSLIFPCLP